MYALNTRQLMDLGFLQGEISIMLNVLNERGSVTLQYLRFLHSTPNRRNG
jgi:hypothetical protein